MIHITTNSTIIPATELRDGDWVIGDFGDMSSLLRYQDSLVQGDFHPVIVDDHLLQLLGFRLSDEQPEGTEAKIYTFRDVGVSVINDQEFIFEGGAKGRIPVHYLHLLQQTWRQLVGEELAADLLEQPHTIEVADDH